MHFIGIHLGTTSSSVAVLKNDKVELIDNEYGSKKTPSYVVFTDIERIVGVEAKEQLAMNPKNTVYGMTHLIGRRFIDHSLRTVREKWRFEVVPVGDVPMICVEFKGEMKVFSAEEISASILRKMNAERHLGEKVTDAVITIPVYFDSSQRQATKHAEIMAGLNVLGIISEPKAVAIAYRHYNKIVGERNLLVYDLGCENFDASVVTIRDDEIEVMSSTRDKNLGGRDFDNRLVEHLIVQFKKKHRIDISSNECAVQRIRQHCKKTICDLSNRLEASVCLDCLSEGIDFEMRITRSRFEILIEDLVERTLTHVEKCIKEVGMDRGTLMTLCLWVVLHEFPKSDIL